MVGSNRPLGPLGDGKVQSCSAICGASRLATAQALGGFMIKAPLPEISHLLLPASSQAKTSGGRTGTSFWNQASTWRTGSDLTVMLPSSSTKFAPWLANTAPTQSTESEVVPRGMPRIAGLRAFFRRCEEGIPCSVLGELIVGRGFGRVHSSDVEAGILLHQVDARARRLRLGTDAGGHDYPMTAGLAEIFDSLANPAVLLDQRGYDVVHRLQLPGIVRGKPVPEGEHIVPRSGLRLCCLRDPQLFAGAGDKIQGKLDLFFVRPFAAELGQGVVGAGHPVVPEAAGELARRMRAAHKWHGERRRSQRRCLQHSAPGQGVHYHPSLFRQRDGPRNSHPPPTRDQHAIRLPAGPGGDHRQPVTLAIGWRSPTRSLPIYEAGSQTMAVAAASERKSRCLTDHLVGIGSRPRGGLPDAHAVSQAALGRRTGPVLGCAGG